MSVLSSPETCEEISNSPTPTTPSKRSLPFSVRTLRRDLKLLSENLYHAELKIGSGASRIARVDVQDFAPPSQVLEIWQSFRSPKKPPQLLVFEELGEAVRQMTEQRRLIYEAHTIELDLYRAIPGSHLDAFLRDFQTLEAVGERLLNSVLQSYAEAKNRFLREEIQPLLQAGYFGDDLTQRRLEIYANRFPSIEKIQKRFGVQLRGPFKIQSLREALQADAESKRAQAERAQAEVELAQAKAERSRIESDAWAAEEKARAEVLAYRRAFEYQERQIRSAIGEKVEALRGQMLQLLHRNLQKLSEKNYEPGKLPAGLKKQLAELVQSASILSETDQSLAQVVADLTQLNTTATTRTAPQDTLREQVDELLEQLETTLAVPDLGAVDELGSEDRAVWTNW